MKVGLHALFCMLYLFESWTHNVLSGLILCTKFFLKLTTGANDKQFGVLHGLLIALYLEIDSDLYGYYIDILQNSSNSNSA